MMYGKCFVLFHIKNTQWISLKTKQMMSYNTNT